MVKVVFEIEYDVADEREARMLAEGHAGWVFSHPSVEAVVVDLESAYKARVISSSGKSLPITERYLEDGE